MDLDAWEVFIQTAASGVISEVLQHLPNGGTFIDIGANVGVVSKAAIEHRDAKVFAFEPTPWCYARLARLPLTVVPVGLGEKPGMVRLWCDVEQNFGWNTLVDEKRTEGMQYLDVPVLPFDGYFDRLFNHLDVVKIDVEGYEYAVLRGMRSALRRLHPVLVVELGWGTSHPKRERQVEEIEWLFDNGYQRVNYDFDQTTDVVFLPA